MAVETIAPGALAAPLAEIKALLRVETSGEDALIAGFARAATDLCERFTGRLLIARGVTEIVARSASWQRLAHMPVRAIEAVAAIGADGSATPLPPGDQAIDIDAAGHGWVRFPGGGGGRARVTYVAGMAGAPADLPEGLRQGVIRMAAHLYLRRDGEGAGEPPAAVSALWRPWRRLRIG